MRKIVVNRCYGGFGLSDEAIQRYSELAGLNLVKVKTSEALYDGTPLDYEGWYLDGVFHPDNYFDCYGLFRDDPHLVQVVEELGRESCGKFAELKIVEIPEDINWYIDDYDGVETVREAHRSW